MVMGARRGTPADLPIDAGFLSQLQEHVAAREIERGIACLRSHQDLIANLDPSQENAARLLAQLAIWTDIGFSGPPLQELLKRFDHSEPGLRSKLSIADYICLRMAEGMAAMGEEAMETAIGHFDFALSLGEELDDRFLLAIVYFWKGRCLRRRGEYDEALIYTGKGKDLAVALGHMRMAAVMKVLESWLLFQQGKWKEAMRISQAAESALRETDDYVTLSATFNPSTGEWRAGKAVSIKRLSFSRMPFAIMASGIHGIRTWRDRWQTWHSPSAGSLFSCRKESTAMPSGAGRPQPAAKRSRAQPAMNRIRASMTIAADWPSFAAKRLSTWMPPRPSISSARTITESVRFTNAAYIHLDSGDFQRAEEEAASAYDVAEQKQDYILMGRARILQCMIENAKVEEEIGEGADPGSHARRAFEFSQEAIDLAKHTQHHLLLANAHLWQGLTQCNSFFDDPEAARESYDLARASCGANPPDNMWQDLQKIGEKILRKGSVHPALKAWSQGAVSYT